jgi:hypothetical protein
MERLFAELSHVVQRTPYSSPSTEIPSRAFLSAQPVARVAQPDCLLTRAFKSRDAEACWAVAREDLLEAIFELDADYIGGEGNRLRGEAFEQVNCHGYISRVRGPVRNGRS